MASVRWREQQVSELREARSDVAATGYLHRDASRLTALPIAWNCRIGANDAFSRRRLRRLDEGVSSVTLGEKRARRVPLDEVRQLKAGCAGVLDRRQEFEYAVVVSRKVFVAEVWIKDHLLW